MVCATQNQLKTTIEQLESTRIDNEEKVPTEEDKDTDQLPDYSIYDDDVNASMLRVLRNEEDEQEQVLNQETVATTNLPEIIEVSDDSSDEADLQVLQTIQPKMQSNTIQPQNLLQQTKPTPPYDL